VDASLTLSVIARPSSSSVRAVPLDVADVDGMLMSSGVESGVGCSAHTVISSTQFSQKMVFVM
jgi:hypothetical protein